MLEIKNVTVRFGKNTILDHINLKLEPGIYALLGENGAGKTTLIRVLTTLLVPASGSVLYNGTDIQKLGSRFRDKVGYMPQYAFYYPDFSAEEFLKYMCILKHIPKKEQKERIWTLLRSVNLDQEKRKKIGNFSGGMRQRLGIAQTLLNDPEIIILDEPTAGLDPNERIRFRNLISEISKNKIVLLATHIVQDVELTANHVILMHKGKILAARQPRMLLEQVKEKVVELCPDESDIEMITQTYTVSNMIFDGNRTRMRIVLGEDECPPEGGQKVPPNLEEAFLYYIQKS